MGHHRGKGFLLPAYFLCWLALCLRVFGLTSQSLWRDEVDVLRFAGRPWNELLTGFVKPGENGPLYHAVLRLWTEVAGQGEFALRFLSALFGVAAVPVLFHLVRRLFPRDPTLASLASVLAAVSPYLVWYGQEGKMYALVVLLGLLSMVGFVAALQRGGWPRWLAYGLVTGLGAYVHFVLALIVMPQVLFFFLGTSRRGGGRRKGWLAGAATALLLSLPLLVWQVPLALEAADTGYVFVPLPEMFASMMQSYTLGVAADATWWRILPFVSIALAGVLLPSSPRFEGRPRALLIAWLLLPAVVFFLLTLNRPLYTARYLIFVQPALIILMACGLGVLARHSRVVAGLGLCLLVALSLWGLWNQGKAPLKADFRGASRSLSGRMGRDDLIVFLIPHGRYSFDYYFAPRVVPLEPAPRSGHFSMYLPVVVVGERPAYRWADGLFTNGGMAPGEADRRMEALVGDSHVVWLVESESWLWDERGLVRAWLDRHGMRTDELRFVRVTLYRYELP